MIALKPQCKASAIDSAADFREALANWFRCDGRDLPWRRTTDPYEVCVSEIMLQQTQVATVLAGRYYERFLAAFPTIDSLADAEDDSLLKAWEGLGYYRRARLLREMAKSVVRNHGGCFPSELDALLRLPGVGRYTAGAIRAFAFDLPSVLVDGNIARVISRLEGMTDPIDSTRGQSVLWDVAERLACAERPRLHHSALMELGQRICRPGLPDCMSCPVSAWCITRSPESLPIKKAKTAMTMVDEHVVFMTDENRRILLHRETTARRQGLWKLPACREEKWLKWPVVESEKYTITRYKVTMHVHASKRRGHVHKPASDEAWIPFDEVSALAMPSPFRRVIGRLLGFS